MTNLIVKTIQLVQLAVLKGKKYINEYNEEDIRWPEPFTNVVNFMDYYDYQI